MPSTSTTADSAPAHGTPAMIRQKPMMMAWISATPITPWATARIVCVDNLVNAAPRSLPAILEKMARQPCAPDRPKAIRMPAMISEGDELQDAQANPCYEGECYFGQLPDLRLQGLHQRWQVRIRLAPY